MSSFSLTNAEQLWGFFAYLERRQIDIAPHLARCRIPDEARTVPDLKLTSKQNYDFLASVSQQEKLKELGWDVGRTLGARAFGSLGLQALERVGADAFEELSHQVQFHASGAHFFLLKEGGQWRFCNIGSVPADSYGYALGEFYGLAVMIDLVRLSLGVKGFMPKSISVRSADWGLVPGDLRDTDIRFSQRYLSLDLPEGTLIPRRRKRPAPVVREINTLSDKLTLLLKAHLKGAALSLGDVAAMTGMSSRSIQRHLALERTDFRTLLRALRMSFARDQLRDTDQSIAEIASLFGFQHTSHFIRAFKQQYGVTPGILRRQLRD